MKREGEGEGEEEDEEGETLELYQLTFSNLLLLYADECSFYDHH